MNGYNTTSKLGNTYLNFIHANQQCHTPIILNNMNLPELLKNYYAPLQHIPMLIDKETAVQYGDINSKMMALIRKIPGAIFDNDVERLAEFYGFEDKDVLTKALTGSQFCQHTVSRNDYILTHSGLKCIEMNFSTTLVGWNIPLFF